ncbi:hypothetical protein SteCoe_30939 [Stentor coeruleus]|uniref:mitogen-activated protein kinase kinase n=1 Tax=Stentor coeruleus TaxID=5963 RepID=A0A1R2B2Q6_9CILI|nr:hypothetical protein SteCoe_30939 [Stentor coeruleus]
MKEEESKFAVPLGKIMISSRLPKAFSQPKHLTNKKLQEHHQELSAANEFKNVKKLLSPLKQSSSKHSAFNKAINKLAFFPKLLNSTPNNSIQTDMLVQSIVRLDEMITISILKSSCRSGIVKKSLHGPSLHLYASKEVPVSTFVIRQKLLEIIKSWQNNQKTSRHWMEVNSSFWNSPEGCVTIVMEYMAGDSLLRLCESIGSIPEKVLRDTTKKILLGLSIHHKKIGPHGGIDLSQIMFSRTGKAKLGLGLTSRLNLKDEGNKKTFSTAEDVFDLGATLLAASLGGSEWANECLNLGGECCLLHSALICTEIPYLPRFSRFYCDFLCAATQYNEEKRAKVNDLIQHEWLKNDDFTGVDVGIKDLLGMSVSNNDRENILNVERQLSMISESLEVIFAGYSEQKVYNSENFKELALEFGVSVDFLQEKLKVAMKKD